MSQVYVTYSRYDAIEKVEFIDRNGKHWDLTEMMLITGIGFSYKVGHIPQVTLTFDAKFSEAHDGL